MRSLRFTSTTPAEDGVVERNFTLAEITGASGAGHQSWPGPVMVIGHGDRPCIWEVTELAPTCGGRCRQVTLYALQVLPEIGRDASVGYGGGMSPTTVIGYR